MGWGGLGGAGTGSKPVPVSCGGKRRDKRGATLGLSLSRVFVMYTKGQGCPEESKITSKRVVRSSAGAYAIYPPFLGSFAYDTPRYGTGCPTPCKNIILGEKMIPQ